MQNFRKYGNSPFAVAVIHGGPGVSGEMAPVARELCSNGGVLEPLQTATTLNGQVRELKTVLQKNGDLPITLIGWSWGAWLSFIVTARYPAFVKKLILIGSGAFEEKYTVNMMDTRLRRLNKNERTEVLSVMSTLSDPTNDNKNLLMARFGALMFKTDSYDPSPYESTRLRYRYDIYERVWTEASKLRRTGKLLDLGKNIECPVVAIHGDYDPHLSEGVKDPLSSVLKNFRFILLKHCGHYPWFERAIKDRFYEILKNEVK